MTNPNLEQRRIREKIVELVEVLFLADERWKERAADIIYYVFADLVQNQGVMSEEEQSHAKLLVELFQDSGSDSPVPTKTAIRSDLDTWVDGKRLRRVVWDYFQWRP